MDASESYFGWEIGDTELDHLRTLNSAAPNTPPENRSLFDLTSHITPSVHTESYERESSLASSLQASSATRDSQPADSPWVSYISHRSVSS